MTDRYLLLNHAIKLLFSRVHIPTIQDVNTEASRQFRNGTAAAGDAGEPVHVGWAGLGWAAEIPVLVHCGGGSGDGPQEEEKYEWAGDAWEVTTVVVEIVGGYDVYVQGTPEFSPMRGWWSGAGVTGEKETGDLLMEVDGSSEYKVIPAVIEPAIEGGAHEFA